MGIFVFDYSLQTPEERNQLVEQILADNPDPPEKYLEILADYLVLCMEKQEKKEKKLLTDNRMATSLNDGVTKQQIIDCANKIKLDTVYKLVCTNSSEEGAE